MHRTGAHSLCQQAGGRTRTRASVGGARALIRQYPAAGC
jgi:hypothetical protein